MIDEQLFQVRRNTPTSRILQIVLVLGVCWTLMIAAGDNKATQGKVIDLCIFVVLASMWNLLTGFSGLISIGQQAFVGLGAYALVVFANGIGMNIYLAIVPAAIVVTIISVPLGVIAFRLKGGYFAIGTWVIAEVARLIVKNNQSTVIGAGTGTSLSVPESLKSGRYSTTTFVAIAIGVSSIVFVYCFMRSRFGLALQSVRDSETGAKSLGVDSYRVRFIGFVLAAFFTSFAAATYYIKGLSIQPDAAFSIGSWTAPIIVMVVIGGLGTIEGPIIGAVLYYLVRDFVSSRNYFSDPLFLILTGIVALTFALFAKNGIWGLLIKKFPSLIIFPLRRRIVIEGFEFDKRGN